MSYHPLRLELSKVQKKELLSFMKSTRDKEEYRRAYAVKQKMEGVPYRTIARTRVSITVMCVYDWIDNYRKHDLDGIKNKRKNGGRRPVISTAKNKEMTKDIVLNKSPRIFGYLKNTWSIRLLAIFPLYWESMLAPNKRGGLSMTLVVYKQPKLELEKEKDDYEQKKGRIR